MPKWLSQFLNKGSLRTHFWWAMGLGFLARSLSAYFVYGPQALDDYKHGVWPAYQVFAGLPIDLPEYRSRILVWLLAAFTEVASWIGIESALWQVRAMYLGLGLVSLAAIYGTYRWVRAVDPERQTVVGPLAMYMMALYPLMPFVSTRAFGEAVSLSLVVLAFGFLESARLSSERGRFRDWLIGFVILGWATLFRFHVGLIYLVYMGILFARHYGKGFFAGLVAGFLTIAAQATVDLFSGKLPLSTIFIYLRENEGGAAKYGVNPWYNPLLLMLGLALVPFSLVLWRGVKPLWQRHWPWLVPVLIFIGVHCVVPHKEERFLYPVVGLWIWALAFLWAYNAHDRLSRLIFSPAYLLLSVLILPVVTLVNTQEGEIEPPALIEDRYGQVIYLDYKSLFGQSRFQFYFLRPPSQIITVTDLSEMNARRIDDLLSNSPHQRAVVLITSEEEAQSQLNSLNNFKTVESKCLTTQESGSLVDRLIYKMNPKHNQRRRPTWYLVCERNRYG